MREEMKIKTIVLTNHYEGEPLSILKEIIGNTFELVMLEETTRHCLENHIQDADYLLVSGRIAVDRELLKKAPKLKMIQRTGVGLDNLDLKYIVEKEIPLYVNAGVNANSVAEHTLMLMLGCLKNNYEINQKMREGIWDKQRTGVACHEIRGKTVGLIGAGNIGRRVAELLKVFQAKVLYYQRHRLSNEVEAQMGLEYRSFEELLKMSDIVSLHCPYDVGDGAMIGEHELSLMHRGSYLINTSRGKLIDENALYAALETGRIAGAGLDVHETEPILKDNPLLRMRNVNITPHIAGVTYEAFYAMMQKAIYNIACFDAGKLIEIEEHQYLKGNQRA